jgi:hypothetical protein
MAQQQLQPMVALPAPPFEPPVLQPAIIEPAEPAGLLSQDGEVERGKILISGGTGQKWELIRTLTDCIHGKVLLAVQFEETAAGRRYAARLSVVKYLLKLRLARQTLEVREQRELQVLSMLLDVVVHPPDRTPDAQFVPLASTRHCLVFVLIIRGVHGIMIHD